MKHQKTLIALAVAATLNVALAQEVANTELQTVVVSATRTPNPLDKTAASVSVVTQEDFEEVSAQTVNEVLKKLPGVDFGGGPRTDGELPTIRGYQGNDIILMVDGARRNANYGLTTPLFIDPYFLGSAEVVRGSASSLYGSGGLGGAMVFNTLSAKDLLVGDQTVGADVRLGYRSGDRSNYQNARVYGKQGDLDTLVAVGYRDFNDIRQAQGGTLPYSSGHSYSGLLKVGYDVDAKTRVELSHQLYSKEAYEPNNPQVISANLQQTHNSQNETVLKLMREGERGDRGLDARFYVTQTNNQRDAAGSLRYWDSEIKTTGLSVQDTRTFAQVHRVTYGLDGYQDKQSTAGDVGVNPAGQLQVVGLFAQDEIKVGDNWRVTPSMRYDDFSTNPVSIAQTSTRHEHLSPKLAVTWFGAPSFSLYGSYGQSYRVPTIWEMYQSLTGTGNLFNFAANTDLRPQIDTTSEIGAKYETRSLVKTNDKFKFSINVFSSQAKDLITSKTIGTYSRTFPFSGSGSIFQNQNISNATRAGGEVNSSYQFNNWSLSAAYSRVRVKNADTGDNLFSPPDKLTTKMSYSIPSSRVTIGLATTAASAQDYDSTVNRRRSAYTTHDLFGSWVLPSKSWRMNFGVTNLTDVKYWVYQSSTAASSMPYEMGRSYYVTLSGSF